MLISSYNYPFCNKEEVPSVILGYSERYIMETNNGKVLDACSLLYNSPFGNDEEILSTIYDNKIFPVHIFGNGSGIPFTNNTFIELIKNLKNIQKKEFDSENLILCNSGSESIELILNILNFSPIYDQIFCFEDSYHGISSLLKFAKKINFNESPKEILKNVLAHKKDNKNIFFIETCIGSGGGIFFSDEFLSELIHLLKINNFIVICDEIISGFKRLTTDRFFKSGKLQNIPDFVCFSKQITNGVVPLSGFFINKNYEFEIVPGITGTGNIISNIIALATLKKLENTNNTNLNSEISYMLKILKNKYKNIKINQCGSFASIHFLDTSCNNSKKNIGQFIASNLSNVLVRGNKYGINICPGYYFSSENFNCLLASLDSCFNKIGVV